MRMQLIDRSALSIALLVLASTAVAHADGTMTVRGAYYKERSTRVVQPMIDADLEVGEAGRVQAHALVDAITSASAASGAAGDSFTETRTEGGGTYMHAFKDLRVGGGLRHSSEPDYVSTFFSLRLESDFAQKNTQLAINLARGSDTLDNSGSQGGLSSVLIGELATSMIAVSASQILSPNSVASLSYDLSYLDGFQENIYRTVVAGGMIEPERVPDTRLRQALAGSVRYYLAATDTAFIGAYRYYRDDWHIQGHAPEIRAIQELAGGDLELHLSYRYYRQRAAFFYKDVYDSNDQSVEPFLTDDDKLGRVRTHNTGIKMSAALKLFGLRGTWADARIEGLFQYLQQDTHYGNAVISQVALRFPVSY